MPELSTRHVAKLLGLSHAALVRYMAAGKIPAPKAIQFGKFKAHLWTEAEVEYVRQLLPRIANGRKTRYKKQTAVSTHGSPGQAQQSRQARDKSAKAKSKTRSKKKK